MATIEEELQTSRIENPYTRAFLSIMFMANYLENLQRQVLEPFGITATQYNVLRILRGQAERCLATYSIKSRMVERNCDASRVVDRMEKQGLVRREGCPNDKRSVLVHITDKGLQLLTELEPHLAGKHYMPALSVEEALLISNLLDKARELAPTDEDGNLMFPEGVPEGGLELADGLEDHEGH